MDRRQSKSQVVNKIPGKEKILYRRNYRWCSQYDDNVKQFPHIARLFQREKTGSEHRKRVFFNETQLTALKKKYIECRYPDQITVFKIAESIKVRPKNVAIWFKNRRALERRTGVSIQLIDEEQLINDDLDTYNHEITLKDTMDTFHNPRINISDNKVLQSLENTNNLHSHSNKRLHSEMQPQNKYADTTSINMEVVDNVYQSSLKDVECQNTKPQRNTFATLELNISNYDQQKRTINGQYSFEQNLKEPISKDNFSHDNEEKISQGNNENWNIHSTSNSYRNEISSLPISQSILKDNSNMFSESYMYYMGPYYNSEIFSNASQNYLQGQFYSAVRSTGVPPENNLKLFENSFNARVSGGLNETRIIKLGTHSQKVLNPSLLRKSMNPINMRGHIYDQSE